jgi:hypothetical protein
MDPPASCGRPFAAVFFDSVIDSEDFEEIFESTATNCGRRFEVDHGLRLDAECLQDAIRTGLIRDI